MPLGTSAEVAEGGSTHPIYTPAVTTLNDSAGQRSPIMMLINHRSMDLQGAASIVRPMLFRDGALFVPDNFRERRIGMDKDQIHTVAILGAIALGILNGGQDVSRYRRMRNK